MQSLWIYSQYGKKGSEKEMRTVFCDVYYYKFNKILKTDAGICTKRYLHIGSKEENCKDFESKEAKKNEKVK